MAVDKFSEPIGDINAVLASRNALEKAIEELQRTCHAHGKDVVRQRLKKKIGEVKVKIADDSKS